MSLDRKVNKPKTRRGKRFLENRSSKLVENAKTALFVRGSTASETVLKAMKNLCALKKPSGIFFNRKNEMRPFEDITKVEHFCQKNDASLFMFGSHSKKRPHNIVIGRMYDFYLLDMFELGVENFVPLEDFKVPKISCGTKPMLLFCGEAFEQSDHQRLKSLFIDFFKGPEVSNVRLQGLEHVITFTAAEGKIYFRSYRTVMKKSGSKIPRIELIEIGPRMNFVIRRTKSASEDLFKLARRQPQELKPKKTKNVKKNPLGTKLGRIHMTRQDFSKLRTRKLKGLKKSKKAQSMKRKTDEDNQPSKKAKIEM